MLSGEAHVVIWSVDIDVCLDNVLWCERLADGIVNILVTGRAKRGIREVGVHSRAIPVGIA